jgi:hypothetical protein
MKEVELDYSDQCYEHGDLTRITGARGAVKRNKTSFKSVSSVEKSQSITRSYSYNTTIDDQKKKRSKREAGS